MALPNSFTNVTFGTGRAGLLIHSQRGSAAGRLSVVPLELISVTSSDADIPLSAEAAALRDSNREGCSKRIAAYRLRGMPSHPARDDWRKTVGIFRNNAPMKETAEEGRRIRECEASK